VQAVRECEEENSLMVSGESPRRNKGSRNRSISSRGIRPFRDSGRMFCPPQARASLI